MAGLSVLGKDTKQHLCQLANIGKIRVVKEFPGMAYSLYIGDKKVRTVTHEELADAERKMAVSRLITEAEKYWEKPLTRAFGDIKHPAIIEQWPYAGYPEHTKEEEEDILDPELFEWEDDED